MGALILAIVATRCVAAAVLKSEMVDVKDKALILLSNLPTPI